MKRVTELQWCVCVQNRDYSAREMRRNGVYQWVVPGYEIEKRKTILVLRGAVAKSNKAPQIHTCTRYIQQ